MKTSNILIIIVVLVITGAAWWLYIRATVDSFKKCVIAGYPVFETYPEQCRTPDGRRFSRDPDYKDKKNDFIRVETPHPSDIVESPLLVKGEARGPWYFEDSFPVEIEDADGNILAQVPAQASGEWMTEDFVPFEVTLDFTTPAEGNGRLILRKDNPSGLPEHADELRIPVRFR